MYESSVPALNTMEHLHQHMDGDGFICDLRPLPLDSLRGASTYIYHSPCNGKVLNCSFFASESKWNGDFHSSGGIFYRVTDLSKACRVERKGKLRTNAEGRAQRFTSRVVLVTA